MHDYLLLSILYIVPKLPAFIDLGIEVYTFFNSFPSSAYILLNAMKLGSF